VKICSLASGSEGNCLYIGSEETHILLDVGISGKRVKEGLAVIDIEPTQIDGILVTHEHSDHVKGLGVLSRRYKKFIYTVEKTFDVICRTPSIGIIDRALFREIIEDTPFFIGDIEVTAYKSFHDATHPVGYTFKHKDNKISVATDLGTYDTYIKGHLSGADVLFIEANHDVRMLEVGPYPFYLKQRILSDLGHLSNDHTADLICDIYDEKLNHVILGHLSHENNMPEVAYESVKVKIESTLGISQKDLKIHIAKRKTNSILLNIKTNS